MPLRRVHILTCRHSGFTLIEVLASLLLVAIVIPVVMQGISLGSTAASATRRRDEAAGLAQSQLAQIIATGDWQSGAVSGTFAPDWPDYTWEARIAPLPDNTFSSSTGATVQELDMQVSWRAGGRPESLTVSTLVYQRASQ